VETIKIPPKPDINLIVKFIEQNQKKEARGVSAQNWFTETGKGNAKGNVGISFSGLSSKQTFIKRVGVREQSLQVQNTSQASPKNAEGETLLHLRGYCYFDRNVVVYGSLKMYATLPCAFKGISQPAKVFGELVPNLKNYALLFVPKKVYINGIPFKVVGGYALSGDGSTINIANEVNDQAIKRILATAGVDAGEKASKLIEKSAEGAQTTVTVNGDVVVKKTNFDIDVIGTSVFWTAVASLVKNTAEYFKDQTERIPITFKIYKGAKVYLDIDAKKLY